MELSRIGPKFQVTIPKAARDAAGLKVGDYVEATALKEGILLRAKTVSDRSTVVESRLQEALADVQAGRVHGPFRTTRELAKALKGRKARPSRRRARR